MAIAARSVTLVSAGTRALASVVTVVTVVVGYQVIAVILARVAFLAILVSVAVEYLVTAAILGRVYQVTLVTVVVA
jgi:hypothetical protein